MRLKVKALLPNNGKISPTYLYLCLFNVLEFLRDVKVYCCNVYP